MIIHPKKAGESRRLKLIPGEKIMSRITSIKVLYTVFSCCIYSTSRWCYMNRFMREFDWWAPFLLFEITWRNILGSRPFHILKSTNSSHFKGILGHFWATSLPTTVAIRGDTINAIPVFLIIVPDPADYHKYWNLHAMRI